MLFLSLVRSRTLLSGCASLVGCKGLCRHWLIDAPAEFCVATGMIWCATDKDNGVLLEDPHQAGGGAQDLSWQCNGQILEQVDNLLYFGLLCDAQCAVQSRTCLEHLRAGHLAQREDLCSSSSI